MIRLMLWIERPEGRRLEVLSLAPTRGLGPETLEDDLMSGAGGKVVLTLYSGQLFGVWRDHLLAACAWRET